VSQRIFTWLECRHADVWTIGQWRCQCSVPLKPTNQSAENHPIFDEIWYADVNQMMPYVNKEPAFYLHFCLLDFIMSPDFVVNWTEEMAILQPHTWRFECMAVGFTQLLQMAFSDIWDQGHGVWCAPERTWRDLSLSISDMLNDGFVSSLPGPNVISCIMATFSSVFAHFSKPLSCRLLVLHVSCSLFCNIASPPFVQFLLGNSASSL